MFLSDQGILHRDISAGNVSISRSLLSSVTHTCDPTEQILLYESWPSQTGHAGFLTDLELAHVTTNTTVEEMSKDVVAVPPQLVTGRYPATSTTPPQSHHNAYSVDRKNASMTVNASHTYISIASFQLIRYDRVRRNSWRSTCSQQECWARISVGNLTTISNPSFGLSGIAL